MRQYNLMIIQIEFVENFFLFNKIEVFFFISIFKKWPITGGEMKYNSNNLEDDTEQRHLLLTG